MRFWPKSWSANKTPTFTPKTYTHVAHYPSTHPHPAPSHHHGAPLLYGGPYRGTHTAHSPFHKVPLPPPAPLPPPPSHFHQNQRMFIREGRNEGFDNFTHRTDAAFDGMRSVPDPPSHGAQYPVTNQPPHQSLLDVGPWPAPNLLSGRRPETHRRPLEQARRKVIGHGFDRKQPLPRGNFNPVTIILKAPSGEINAWQLPKKDFEEDNSPFSPRTRDPHALKRELERITPTWMATYGYTDHEVWRAEQNRLGHLGISPENQREQLTDLAARMGGRRKTIYGQPNHFSGRLVSDEI